jgi:ABC-type antimicrobial peptide transport system permease subunit
MKFKYYIVILISGDKIQNSVNYDKLKEFFKTCSHVNNILIYTYSIDEFRELTKYLTAGPCVYVFGPKKEMVYFELTPDKQKTKDLLLFYVNKLLVESYEKNITKEQYKLLKDLSKDILGLNKLYPDQKLIELELSKIKYFNNIEKNYIFKLYNYQKKVKNDDKVVEQKQEVIDLEKKVEEILSLNGSNL